nr:ACD11 homolog protein-like [Tanacetum cinerariifolium]
MDKPVVTLVYTRKPKAANKKVPNKLEPNNSWGSSSSNVPFSLLNCKLSKSSSGTWTPIMGYGDYQIGNVTISRIPGLKNLVDILTEVRDLLEASNKFNTLSSVVDHDLKNKTVRSPGSHTRNLRRVRQGLDLIRELFQNFISTENHSLKKAATTAYQQCCAPYHTWAVRTAVSAGMCTLPTREQLLLNLNETDKTAEKEMRRYIKASNDVIKTIDNLYIARGITLDW